MPITRAALEPMYAMLGHELPLGPGWTFEPKYDGMRVLAEATSRQARLMTRNGKDKSAQFPEVVAALRRLASDAGRSVTLDGEVVARPTRARRAHAAATAPASSDFQQLQSRMHLLDAPEVARLSVEAPATLVAFDLLRDGRATLATRPWTERRARLEALFALSLARDPALVLSNTSPRGATMLARARRAGWEGIIAKRTSASYQPGSRSEDWLKLKLQFRAEFVVGGFTEPRNSRPFLGALLLGAHDADGALVYVGHTGGGFDREGLREMRARLDRIERRTSPFADAPRTNEPAHWVAPKIVVEVKFAEWTADAKLRQPIFLGVRDDKTARDVTIEGVSLQRWGTGEIADDAA
ncbi:MAG TPA: non-homologous end-joining DNA ligase [Gemmatimonadaceae bacterium]|nr:non-homologous end-joining DNA ligase [Gemmatimonadaceae bacterium]